MREPPGESKQMSSAQGEQPWQDASLLSLWHRNAYGITTATLLYEDFVFKVYATCQMVSEICSLIFREDVGWRLFTCVFPSDCIYCCTALRSRVFLVTSLTVASHPMALTC